MSYIPENQLLEPSIIKLLEGIEQFNKASDNRINNVTEWTSEHIEKLTEIKKELVDLHTKLNILKSE